MAAASSRRTGTSSRWSCRRLSSLAVLLLALAFPAAASAHARLVGSQPADGSVLADAPKDVRLLFDETVRATGGALAVDDHGRSVLAGPEQRLGGNTRAVVIPLRAGLRRGAYTVRWRVISDDGHLISGVIAFAVGVGSPRPVPSLSAGGGGPSASAVLLRLLFLAGVLLAGGAGLTGRFLRAGRRLETAVVGAGLALVAAGGFGLLALEPVGGTRFGHVTVGAAIAGAVGAGAALLSLVVPGLALAASGLGILVLAAPTLAGHALDPHRVRALVAVADFAHVAAASVWIGGLLLLALSRSPTGLRRFPRVALASVAILGAAGVGRAFAAFPRVGDLVHTGYGRDVLVKTGLLAATLGLAWINRRRLLELGFATELVLIAGLIAAVAVLTDLRPPARTAARIALPAPPPAPAQDALVLATEDGDLALALAASPRGRRIAVQVTTLGQDGNGVDGLGVTVGGAGTTSCGSGCYAATLPLPAPPRRVPVRVSERTFVFTLPAQWPAPRATAIVTRVDHAFRALRTLVTHERLGSSPRNVLVTTYRAQAPNRLEYRIVNGPQAVIIGGTRWDRDTPHGRWQRSDQDPLRQPEPFWGPDPRHNARLLSPGHASFYDPKLPAWFELTFDPRTARLLALKMTAQAHFMHHRYTGFNAPFEIVPPRSTQP